MAAAHSSRPALSLAELGYFMTFSISLIVISPRRRFSSSTIGSVEVSTLRIVRHARSIVTVPVRAGGRS